MKKIIFTFIITIMCIINFFCILFFLNKNEETILTLTKLKQTKELYLANNVIDEKILINDYLEYIKLLEKSDNEYWYLYDIQNNYFLLYKNEIPEYFDMNIKKHFINFKKNYDSNIILDTKNNEILLTTKYFEINSTPYIIGISEYTDLIYKINNDLFNFYIFGQSIILSILLIIFNILHIKKVKKIKYIEKDKIINKYNLNSNLNNNLNNSLTYYIDELTEHEYIMERFNKLILELKKNNINYNIFKISDDKFWIIDDFFKDNIYKIKKNKNELIILLIDGTEEQKQMLEEFSIK